MNSYPEVIKQLKFLVKNISQCNFLSNEDKEDVVQDAILQIYLKYKEGKIEDDFNKIKGYTFITLRNFCLHRKNKNSKIPQINLVEEMLPEEELEMTEEEYQELLDRLDKLLKKCEFNEEQLQFLELILSNHSQKEIAVKMNLNGLRFSSLSNIVRNELRRKLKNKKGRKYERKIK
jgi:DNA-directed RNA polymerase specialized sigma24 family protein